MNRTRHYLNALLALNVAIMALTAAFFWFHGQAQDRIFDRIVHYHNSVARAVQVSLTELHYISDDLLRQAALRGDPAIFALPEQGADTSFEKIHGHIAALAEQKKVISSIQREHSDPSFETSTDSVLRAFDPVLRIGAQDDPDQRNLSAQLELIDELGTRLRNLLSIHLAEQDRLTASGPHNGLNHPEYLLLVVVLLTLFGLAAGLGVIRSVTAANAEREAAFQVLLQNERDLRLLTDGLAAAQRIARIGNWEWDRETEMEWWSDENYRIIGLEPGAARACDETFFNTIHEQDRHKVAGVMDEAKRNACPYQVDFRVVLPDGEIRYVREIGEPIFDSDGRFTSQRGTIQDITEQYLTESRLAETVRRLEAAQRIARVADWEWDPDSQSLDWPPQMREVLGLQDSDEPISNDAFLAMLQPEDRERLLDLIRQALEHGEPYAMEYRFLAPDGGMRTIMEFGEPFTPPGSTKVRLRGTIQDVTETRRRERELREIQERFSLAFQLSPSATAISEVETGIHVYVNDKWVEVLGHPREEAIGRTADEMGIWADPADRARAIELLKRDGRFREFEAQYRTRAGEIRDFLISAEPVPIGDKPHMLIVGYDITERKGMERELRETADRLEKSQTIGKIGSWVWEFEEDKEWWSDEVYRMYGAEPGKIIVPGGFEFLDYVHPDDRERIRIGLEQAIRDGKPFVEEYRIRRLDGSEIVLLDQGEVEFDADGKPARLRGTAQDITERKRAELALRETKERLEEAQHLGRMGSWTWEPEEDVEWWSDEQYRIFGLEPGSVLLDGFGFLAYVHPDDRDRVEEVERHAADTNTPFAVEYRIVRPDGTEHTVFEQGEWIEDDITGKPQWRGIVQDITERKRTEQDLARLNADLEQRVEERTEELRAAQEELVKRERLATLGQLTATVSHELRNPLGAIRTSLYVVERKSAQSDGRLDEAIGRISRSITRCDNIIDELLDYTRMRDTELEPIDIDQCLATMLAEQPVPEGILIRTNYKIGGKAIMADQDRLRRAVINIYENACQAMKSNGQSIETDIPQEKILTITTGGNNGRAEIIFEDTGPGIAEDTLERIFEPLFSTKNFGVGLGLPIVQQIMKQHGGGVEAYNRNGKGAKFVLWLPLEAKENIAVKAPAAASSKR